MAYDETLAERIRTILKRRKGISERKMFGGVAFLLNGHMCCGVVQKNLMLRLGNEAAAAALADPQAREMDFTGKPMKSMVYVLPAGHRRVEDLRRWLERALKFARTLPPK